MSSFEVVSLIGLVALALLGTAQYAQSRELRRALERLSRGEAARAMLGQRSVHVREALPEPVREVPEATPTTRDRPTRVDAPPGSASAADRKRAREPFKPPSLAPAPDYAAQARRPAPDAEVAPESTPEAATIAVPGLVPAAPRPAMPPPAPAVMEPELPGPAAPELPANAAETARVPTTRPSSSKRASTAGAAPVAVAPPGSAPVLAPAPGIVAAGLGERPREVRSERPAPHLPLRRATLLGIPPATTPPPASVAPARSLGPLPTPAAPARLPGSPAPVAPSVDTRDERTSELDDDEPTRLGPRPSPQQLGLAPAVDRHIVATLASMPAVVPTSTRPAPTVNVIEADGDRRTTLEPGEAPALRAAP